MSTPEPGQSFRQFPPYVALLGLNRAPFARDDDDFFFAHPAFNQRLEMLLKQIDGEGLVMISGEHDSGKSTLIKHLLACNDGSWRVCRIDADPMSEPASLTERLFTVFGDDGEDRGTLADLSTRLRARRARDQKPLLIVDNAHLLPERSLEMVLDMCTWRDSEGILIQGLLFTEPQIKTSLQLVPDELRDRLPMQQIYINAFTPAQTAEYLLHRLRLAGLEGELPFGDDELSQLQRASQGLPGRIDKAAHRALLERALDSKGGKKERRRKPAGGGGTTGDGRRRPLRLALLGLALAALAGVGYGVLVPLSNDGAPPAAASTERELHPLSLPPASDEEPPRETPKGEPEPRLMIRAAEPGEEQKVAEGPSPSSAAETPDEASTPPAAEPSPIAAEPTPVPTPTETAAVEPPEPLPAPPMPTPLSSPLRTADTPMDEQGVLALDPAKYTIQLMSNESEAQMREFIHHHGLGGRTALIRLRYPNGADKYTILFGLYDLNRDAKAAIGELPAELRAYAPWSRNISKIQQELRALDGR
ncbi:AAA family ATPase [Endothiovibrio diazotrophicus]